MFAFFRSMAGRIFWLLFVGVAAAAILATAVVDYRRVADLERVHREAAADRLHDYIADLGDGRPPGLVPGGIVNVDLAPERPPKGAPDPELTRVLVDRLGVGPNVRAETAPLSACAALVQPIRPPKTRVTARRCSLVSFALGGEDMQLAVDWPPRPASAWRVFDPIFLTVLLFAAAVLAVVAARMTARPLNQLASAAATFGLDLDRPALDERGPSEVAAAAKAFNAMQTRLRQDLATRRHMLAAITHDLRTPLTRLRLRLEKVRDTELRERLIADIAAMDQLVQEGVELARSADRGEPQVTVDLDALLESLAEDEADAGHKVAFTGGAACDVAVRPTGFARALSNLIANAVGHGGSAEISAARDDDQAVIRIRDRGPGIPETQLEEVFEPFVRLEASRSRETGGAGLGLTIARTLVEQSGGRLTLANAEGGGLAAQIILPAFRRDAAP